MSRDHQGKPKYRQIADDLRAAIRAGEYQPGDRFPGEEALMERYGVARMTARQALVVLRAEKLIETRHGVGTFVAEISGSLFDLLDAKSLSVPWLTSQQYEALMLGPRHGQPSYREIGDWLRLAIRARIFSPGAKLPEQAQLAEYFGVRRTTIQKALRILRSEGLISSIKGRGTFVRSGRTLADVELRPILQRALGHDDVTIDIVDSFSEIAETVQDYLDQVLAGNAPAPKAISIRMLIPQEPVPGHRPSDPLDKSIDNAFEADRTMAEEYAGSILEAVHDLQALDLSNDAQAEVRVALPPLVRVYLFNKNEAFAGVIPPGWPHVLRSADDATFYYRLDHSADDGTTVDELADIASIRAIQRWFDSVWTTVSHEWTPSQPRKDSAADGQ